MLGAETDLAWGQQGLPTGAPREASQDTLIVYTSSDQAISCFA